MSTGERYQIRAKISMMLREANLHEDRQTEEGRTKARDLRITAYALNDELKGRIQ